MTENAPPQPLRVLFVSACPTNEVRIRVDAELRSLREVVRTQPGRIALFDSVASSFEGLHRELIERDYDILHISAHGTEDSLVLERPDGEAQEVDTGTLTEIFARRADTLRCVVLNACWSATWFARPLAPAMVVMNGEIDDEGALGFTRAFYEALAAGRTIEAAFAEGHIRGGHAAGGRPFDPMLTSNNGGVLGARTLRDYAPELIRHCQFPCDLSREFDDPANVDWADIAERIREFAHRPDLRNYLAKAEYQILLACHGSVAFLLGREFGREAPVHPVQGRVRPILWRVDPEVVNDDPDWRVEELGDPRSDTLALAVSLAQPIGGAVLRHFEQLGVSARVLEFQVPGPDGANVRSGDHAAKLARTLQRRLDDLRGADPRPVHLFMAAPNGFAFLLGKRGAAGLGAVQLYEFDTATRTYAPSILAR